MAVKVKSSKPEPWWVKMLKAFRVFEFNWDEEEKSIIIGFTKEW